MNLGEIKAIEYLQSQQWKVENLTSCEQFFSKDIDLFAVKEDRQHTIEVKWDSRIADTGNMFVETITDLDKGKAGWFEFIEAEYIFYGDSRNNLFYVFKTDDLRQYVSDNIMEERKAKDTNQFGKLKKVSQGMLVPIEDFAMTFPVQIIKLQ